MRTSAKYLSLVIVSTLIGACSSDSTDGKSRFASDDMSFLSKLQTYQPEIKGPQIVFEGETIQLELINMPTEVEKLRWRVDGRILQNSTSQVSFDAEITDFHRFDLELYFRDGDVLTTPYFVSVTGYQDGLSCLKDLKIQTQSVFFHDEPVVASLVTPNCLTSGISGAKWSIVNQNFLSDIKKEHNYGTLPEDQYILVAEVYSSNLRDKLFTLRAVVNVVTRPQENQNSDKCSTEGIEQVISENTETIEISCGLDGKKNQTRQIVNKTRCQRSSSGNLDWVTLPPKTNVLSESQCLGQSCILNLENSSEKLMDGQIKLGLPNGEKIENLNCQFKEVGYFKKYRLLKDIQCRNGSLEITQTYQGDLIKERECPQYSWVPKDEWTDCSADCGGVQTQKYACLDQYQNLSDESRCGEKLEKNTRICDKNPEAAAYQTKTESEEHANSPKKCSANQIGVIIQKRTVTRIENYACVNHEVVKVDELTTFSPWQTESMCRDYVASRCSHDSLSIEQAKKRYQWMLKCQNELPEIKKFLDQHKEFGIKDSKGRNFDTKRPLYATFMQIKNGKEVLWKAPVAETADCKMPESAYVAAVCVSSCATPDQYILVKKHQSKLPEFLRFDEVHSKKVPLVMTLKSPVLNAKNNITHSKVDQWVTEVVDTEHEIKWIKLKSGGQLKLTPNHPLITPDGNLKLVQDLKVGDHLVKSDGSRDQIEKIQDIKHFGKVYNVFTQSAAPEHNIVIINGYMSGSAMFQNEYANLINRRIFRGKLTEGVR